MERLTGRINVNRSLLEDKLNLNLSATYSYIDREDPALSGSAGHQGDLLGATYAANPTWKNDPDLGTDDIGGQFNPAAALNYYNSTAVTQRVLGNFSADYKIMKDLKFKVTYGLDYTVSDRITLLSKKARLGADVFGFGQGQLNFNQGLSHLFEGTLNYKKDLDIVSIEILGGYSAQSFQDKYHWAAARGFEGEDFESMENDLENSYNAANDAAKAIYQDYNNWGVGNINGLPAAGADKSGFVNSIKPEVASSFFDKPSGVNVEAIGANFYDRTDFLQSFFGRANFSFLNKYLITANLRADGSSKFGDENKYGVFPSVALAWKIHEESFIPDFFNTLKLRGGWGVVGNQEGLGYGNFVRRERWGNVSIANDRKISFPGIVTEGFANSDLKWEKTTQQSIGLDFAMLEGRFYGSIDLYLKETDDLLLKANVAQPAANSTAFQNLDATVENRGWELALGVDAISTEDITLNINGNISQNTNEIKNFEGVINAGAIRGQGLTGAFAQRLVTGRSLFSYYLLDFKGYDANGQPIKSTRGFVDKSALPEWNAGLSLSLKVKNFDLSAYFAGQFGFWVYNNTANAFFTAGSINNSRNVTPEVLTSGEGALAEAEASTRFLEKGDFIRLQSMSIGYNFPLAPGSAIKGLRVSLNAQNLFLITDYSGLDPEVSSSPANSTRDSGALDLLNDLPTAGIDYTAYPRPRTFTLGLNLRF